MRFIELLYGIRNPLLTEFMMTITVFGSAFFVPIVIIFLYVFKKKKESYFLTLSFVLSEGITIFLKYVFYSPRPDIGIIRTLMPSFPSAHSALAFSSALVLGNFFKRGKIYFLILAVFVAFSRLYLGVHYLEDVLAGVFIGILIGLGLTKSEVKLTVFVDRLKKKLQSKVK